MWGYEMDDAMSKLDPDFEEPGVRMRWFARRMRNLAARFKRLRATDGRRAERREAYGSNLHSSEEGP